MKKYNDARRAADSSLFSEFSATSLNLALIKKRVSRYTTMGTFSFFNTIIYSLSTSPDAGGLDQS
jgi:hypothetical protein